MRARMNLCKLYEPYAYYAYDYGFALYEMGEGEIFFLGDNRTNSKDSRYKEGDSHFSDRLYKATDVYGVVPDWAIKYKAFLKYLPGMRVQIFLTRNKKIIMKFTEDNR